MKTAQIAINELLKTHHIILLQEHWLFQFQIHILNEVSENICFTGKSVDLNNSIQPTQLPRGYGGVAILWDKSIDKLITVIPDGNERIQCVEYKDNFTKPILIICVYLPTGGAGTDDEYMDCISHLEEILQKHSSSHEILIGGDLNIDLNKCKSSKKKTYLTNFLKDFELQVTFDNQTYVNPQGQDCSEIDYFLHTNMCERQITKKTVLKELESNVSDHYPVSVSLLTCSSKETQKSEPKETAQSISCATRINWTKVDKEKYAQIVSKDIQHVINHKKDTNLDIEYAINSVSNILVNAAKKCHPQKKKNKNKPKLRVWNPDISNALKKNRESYKLWRQAGKPDNPDNPTLVQKKESKRKFRSCCRIEAAKRFIKHKEHIMEAKCYDSKTFHKLVKKNRGSNSVAISDLNVQNKCYSGEENVIDGFKYHFESLATMKDDPDYDIEFNNLVDYDYDIISELTPLKKIPGVSHEEFENAIKSLNKGKSPDIYGLTIENILYGGPDLKYLLLELINIIFSSGTVPHTLKHGLLTPVFKKKGKITDSKNYRGITVLPVLGKLIESVLRTRMRVKTEPTHCLLQRGFTARSSPLNAALIVEETRRNFEDEKKSLVLVALDAKSAFDVVDHKIMMRQLYHCGVDDMHWKLIDSLHTGAVSAIKWGGNVSDSFQIELGVRQGGVLSADLYKVYVDPVLHTVSGASVGARIGNISCAVPTCADDIIVASEDSPQAQVIVSTAGGFSQQRRYKIQPDKSVVMGCENNNGSVTLQLLGNDMPNVKSTTHLGIQRSVSGAITLDETITNNIQKARKTCYSLMSAGLHGKNGLDPATCVHLIKIYVLPVLTYGLEIILPKKKHIDRLNLFLKTLLKQVLSLPTQCADPVPYILSGLLPIEAQIHIKALNFFNNICSLPEETVEKRLARRQCAIKSSKSVSWFMEIKKLLLTYELPDIDSLLECSIPRNTWKKQIFKKISEFWTNQVVEVAKSYSSLRYLCCDNYVPGKAHPLLRLHVDSTRDANRVRLKLKLASGCYILQSNRAAFNQNEVNPTCLLCGEEDENLAHFLLRCKGLETVRQPILGDIHHTIQDLSGTDFYKLCTEDKLRMLIDCSYTFNKPSCRTSVEHISKVDFHCKRLIFALDAMRYQMLSKLDTRKR